MVSLKYNQAREVLNKNTLESKGWLKTRDDGDKEYNHIVVVEKENVIKAAFENNYYGLQSLGTVISYINDMTDEQNASALCGTCPNEYDISCHARIPATLAMGYSRRRSLCDQSSREHNP